MSSSDIDTAMCTFEAFNRHDDDAVIAQYTEDCEYHDIPDLPDAVVHRGAAGVRTWIGNLRAVGGDQMSLDASVLAAEGGTVLTKAIGKGMGQGDRMPIEWTAYGVFEVSDGQIACARVFLDEAQARAAAGFDGG